MKITFTSISLVIVPFLFLTACGASSDDAKKVEVNTTPVVSAPAPVTKADVSEKIKTATVSTSSPKIESSKFVEGKHYVEIFPEMQTDAPAGKVEVVELMWLGCPHCYALEPTMLKYKKNHPDFVDFKQVPAMLNPTWSADANTFYLAKVLDPSGEKELITRVFQAIHEQKRRLRGDSAVKRFFTQLGYSEAEVDNAKNSMAFQVMIKRAQEISQASQAQSVPTLIINGKYRTSPYIAGSEENLMEIIDMLTKREKK